MHRSVMDYMPMASLALAITFSAPATAQDDGMREQLIDMVLQIQQLQDEVRMLRGQLEEQAHEIDTLKLRQRDQYLDLDQRIGELSSLRPAASATVQTAPAAAIIPPEEDVPEVRTETRQPSTITGLATPQSSAATVADNPQAEKEAYDTAFQALKELRYANAAQEFQDFLDRYPQSDLADNAQYWLGESYYVTRNYEIALESFQAVMSNYPESPKVPDCLLKIGYTHYELKQWELARSALTQVQEQYPNTTVARLAENRLRSMRVEGHY